MRAVYPWSAVVGQDALKHALLLCAIDPAIGGVLVQGPRGVAKTTLARALAELVTGRFVELPLGASEERVSGSLDLAAALRDGEVAFSPGLLARAHEGVLYVDEVNLLPDALVDLLLDAAASGQNVVERDGVSHVHPARFVLIGTMNPDEGELRPQLTDRFGLSVHAQGEITPSERAQIVARRLAFDRDPAAFVAQHERAQVALAERCRDARLRAQSIALEGPALELVAARCYEARVEGVRADLAMLRAARAHAAWHARAEITAADVEAVAELALAHRRHERAPTPPRSSGGSSGTQAGAKSASQSSASSAPKSSASTTESATSPSERAGEGALAPVPVRAAAPVSLPAWLGMQRDRNLRGEPRRRGRARIRGPRGAPERLGASGAIDWFATLSRAPRPRLSDLRYRERRAPSAQLCVVALDCSASMLRSGALAAAKSVALAFQAQATRAGAHVAVLAFQGAEARIEVDTGVRQQQRTRALHALGAGGGTPLRAALQQAFALCTSPRFRALAVHKRIVLLTDGRTQESLAGFERAREQASLLVIDCERGPVRLGRAGAIAHTLGACSLHVDALR